MEQIKNLTKEAIDLLSNIIAIPSISRNEKDVADFMEEFMRQKGLQPQRHGNNLWLIGKHYSDKKRTLLMNAHIDTVKPAAGWQHNPYEACMEGNKLFGLGSNDCGGGLVSLFFTFLALNESDNTEYNLVYLASCEEEVSGKGGIESVIPLLPKIDIAIVGEPTKMLPAIAEKGLMVLDITAKGVSGHAAREEGVNAIYKMMADIEWIRNYKFEKVSPLLGPVKMSVTMINAGSQHNVVPDRCNIVVDVRSNELYSNQDIFKLISENVESEVVARSFRLSSSGIDKDEPLVKRAISLGGNPFGSPTLSDQALMPFPSFKMGPGDSARSHTADEYIITEEIEQAINIYINMLKK